MRKRIACGMAMAIMVLGPASGHAGLLVQDSFNVGGVVVLE